MPKKKRPDEDPKKQFERFVKTAREHGVDEDAAKEKFKGLSREPAEEPAPSTQRRRSHS